MYRDTVGYEDFHAVPHFNFQLNRWRPFLPEAELRAAATEITCINTWQSVFLDRAAAAERAGEHAHAAFYYRAAEFFMPHDTSLASETYDQFRTHFSAVDWGIRYETAKIPYDGHILPAYVVTPDGPPRETILIHGGFDSFAEELLPQFAEGFADQGFRIILFEGPGQGRCLNEYGMPMPHNWARPVKAVLDHFDIDSCTLIGISLGGCLALRAAAFEPRIKRVIADDVLESFFGCLANRLGARRAKVLAFMLRHNLKGPVNRALNRARRADPLTGWAIDHGLRVSGSETPYDYVKWAQGMTTSDVSHLVEQDCLLLAARDDHLVPFDQFQNQISTLANARSVTARVFTAAEHAGQHCQVGNIGLANRVMIDWLNERLSKASC